MYLTRIAALLLTSTAVSAYAVTLPVGAYTLSAHTTTTGIHQSVDQGVLSGTLTFNAASQITYANVLFTDTTAGTSFLFTQPSSTDLEDHDQLLFAPIYNAQDPSIVFQFAISTNTSTGVYELTCGVDCHDDVLIPGAGGRLDEELDFGTLTPAPEPSSLVLLGTGVLAIGAALRRRLSVPA